MTRYLCGLCRGIYIGYKWYETADAENYWDKYRNLHGKGYDAVVQYPFGYGLSYTDFDWKVVKARGKKKNWQQTVL